MRQFLQYTMVAVLALGCRQPVPPQLDPELTALEKYHSYDLGISISHPARYRVVEDRNSLILSDGGLTAIRVTLASRAEARNRGLWAHSDPVGNVGFGSTTGEFYRYRHWDGPSWVPTLAYVVDHRGLELGVEFRTLAQEFDAVHRQVLQSLELSDETSQR